eukprot:snap_masked-scaffold43_size480169-processed-gene-3.16 protein:Tk12743 transcript:snap_masked-scaffold43_size480169-processed-gene-3.16-mRNA-1 annotation:"hypothetical protein ER33_07275"
MASGKSDKCLYLSGLPAAWSEDDTAVVLDEAALAAWLETALAAAAIRPVKVILIKAKSPAADSREALVEMSGPEDAQAVLDILKGRCSSELSAHPGEANARACLPDEACHARPVHVEFAHDNNNRRWAGFNPGSTPAVLGCQLNCRASGPRDGFTRLGLAVCQALDSGRRG